MNKVYSMLGLSMKAGKAASGEFAVETAIKSTKGAKAQLVLIAQDASDNTKKHFSDMCTYRNIPICFFGTKEELGRALGKAERSSVCVTDPGFAQSLIKLLEA